MPPAPARDERYTHSKPRRSSMSEISRANTASSCRFSTRDHVDDQVAERGASPLRRLPAVDRVAQVVGQVADRLRLWGAGRERLGAGLDALQARGHHRRQHEVRVAVGAGDAVLDVARLAVPADAEGRRATLRAEVERGRHEVGGIEALVGVHVRAREHHELGCAAHDAADELAADLRQALPVGVEQVLAARPGKRQVDVPGRAHAGGGEARQERRRAARLRGDLTREQLAERGPVGRGQGGGRLEGDLVLAVAHLALHRLDRDAAGDERPPQLAEQRPRRDRRGRWSSRSASRCTRLEVAVALARGPASKVSAKTKNSYSTAAHGV